VNKLIIPAVIVAIGALSPGAFSQAPNSDAKTYYTTPLENDASRVVRLRAVTFPPRADSGFHRYFGDQWNTVQEGEVTFTIKGQEPRTLKLGDYAYVPRGTVHRNAALANPKIDAQLADVGGTAMAVNIPSHSRNRASSGNALARLYPSLCIAKQ
jgi:quercetin dioxygenase-like cupin family protein